MKKLLAVLVVSALPLVGLVPSAVAAESVIDVNGHGDIQPAGLVMWWNPCGNPAGAATQLPTKLVSPHGQLGSSSLGWDFTVAGNEAGPLAYWSDTSGLTQLSVQFSSDGFVDGHVIALFDVQNDNGATGWYVGTSNKFTFDSDNGSQITAGGVNFDWQFVDANWNHVAGFDLNDYTIAEMGTQFGDAGGVYAGMVLGCNTNSFYLDDLTIGDSVNTFSYNLETPQIASMAHIEYSPDGRTVRNGNLTVDIGRRVRVLGHAHGHADGIYFAGAGSLWAQPYGKSWRRVATGTYDPDYYASFVQRPDHRTVYYFATGASSVHTADSSELMVVNVRGRISAKILDRTLVEGQRITALGRIRPANGGQKLKLQRRVNGTWKTISRGRTNRRGEYRVNAVAAAPGTWKVRVLMESGNGNLGNRSRVIEVTVKKYVPPPPKPDDNISTLPPPPVIVDEPAPPAPDPNRRSIVSARMTAVVPRPTLPTY